MDLHRGSAFNGRGRLSPGTLTGTFGCTPDGKRTGPYVPSSGRDSSQKIGGDQEGQWKLGDDQEGPYDRSGLVLERGSHESPMFWSTSGL